MRSVERDRAGTSRARIAARIRTARTVAIAAVTAAALAVGPAAAAPSAAARPAAAPRAAVGSSESAIGGLFGDVIDGTSEGVVSSLVGFGLAGISDDEATDQTLDEISDQLAEISDQLTDIEDELDAIEQELEQQTCDLETASSTLDARSFIDDLIATYDDDLSSGATTQEIEAFVAEILTGSGNGGVSLQDTLLSLNDALLDAGTAQGIIAACADAVGAPTAGTFGDTAYYDQLTNMVEFFYGYQTKAILLLTEAYHWEAYRSWSESSASSGTSITPATIGDICDGATGDTAIYCGQAADLVDLTYDNLQDQFALSGAPYSVSGQSTVLNGSGYLYVQSLEDYTDTVWPGVVCEEPLTAASPCGPAMGTNQASLAGQTYAGREDWSPATAPMLRTLLDGWTSTADTAGDYLDDQGFSNMGSKILLTPTTYTATPSCSPDHCNPSGQIFSLSAACFVDTSVELSRSVQPFCYDGTTTDGLTYGSASDLLQSDGLYDDDDCLKFDASDWLPADSADGFYDGTYYAELGIPSCSDPYWDGGPFGWLLDASGGSGTQYVLPALDTSTVTCTTNHDGTARATTNAGGVPTMCGTDFDTWFADLVPSPYPSSSATVTITDSGYSPRYVTVAEGSTVRWVHRGLEAHSVTADDGSFDSSPDCPAACLTTGDTYARALAAPATVRYHDRIDGGPGGVGMSGTIRVRAAAPTAPTAPQEAAPAAPVTQQPRYTG